MATFQAARKKFSSATRCRRAQGSDVNDVHHVINPHRARRTTGRLPATAPWADDGARRQDRHRRDLRYGLGPTCTKWGAHQPAPSDYGVSPNRSKNLTRQSPHIYFDSTFRGSKASFQGDPIRASAGALRGRRRRARARGLAESGGSEAALTLGGFGRGQRRRAAPAPAGGLDVSRRRALGASIGSAEGRRAALGVGVRSGGGSSGQSSGGARLRAGIAAAVL